MRTVALSVMVLLLAASADADPQHTATGCTYPEVNAAVTAAVDGDVVIVPACPAGVTWTSTLTYSKAISLQGAGIGNTVINSSGLILVVTPGAGAAHSRISGFTFNGPIRFDAPTNSLYWIRVDHNRIVRTNQSIGTFDNHIWGTSRILIDHNQLVHNGSTDIRFWIFDGQNGYDVAVWREESAIGTTNAVFIEDNSFENVTVQSGNEMAFQIWWAGRVVFRYNTVRNFAIDAHDYRGSSQRGARSWEIYRNTWTNDSGFDPPWMHFRGGTGVIHNNTFTDNGPQDHAIQFFAYSTTGYVSDCCCYSSPDYLYVIDNIGRGKLTGTISQVVVSGAYRDCTAAYRPNWSHAAEPVYLWSNTRNGVDPTILISNVPDGDNCLAACGQTQRASDVIQLNRDYYVNVQRPGYTEYTYPHPIQSAWDSATYPTAPTNLRVQ